MKNKNFISGILVCLFMCLACRAYAGELVQFRQKAGKEILEINVAKKEPRKVFTVGNPDRLVIDVPSIAGKHSLSLPVSYRGKLIKSARFGQFDRKTSRFVFDLNQRVNVSSVKVVDKKLLVEIDGNVGKLPDIKKNKAGISSSAASKKNGLEINSPKKNAKSNLPPMIVIDAGHGGVDPGTIGPDNTQEKDIVLEYAKALKAKLLQTKKYRVLLTRTGDEFIMLRKRVEIARKAGASLFISLHADSAEEAMARGLSVYTVSEKASDKEAAALAARENKSDIIGGMDLSDERPDVADILISLAQRETKNNAAVFADLLVIKLGDRVRLLPNSHRFAGFAVLKAPDIPSVLIEVGFLSHPQEEKELKTRQYRDKVVDGIVSGIDMFFRKKSSGMAGL